MEQQEPMIANTKCTFVDGSVYYQKTISNENRCSFRAEYNVLYLDPNCKVKAKVTRLQKIKELKAEGLIK